MALGEGELRVQSVFTNAMAQMSPCPWREDHPRNKEIPSARAVAKLMDLGKATRPAPPTPGNCLRLWAQFVTNTTGVGAAVTDEINTTECLVQLAVSLWVVEVRSKLSRGEDGQLFMG